MSSDTPRTDEACSLGVASQVTNLVLVARQLERELDDAKAALLEIHNRSGISKQLQHGNTAELTAIIGDIHQIADAAREEIRAAEREDCQHDWQLAGATTASDGWKCLKCGMKVETYPGVVPPRMYRRREE